jgi:fumarate reductase flavoprotein subunit
MVSIRVCKVSILQFHYKIVLFLQTRYPEMLFSGNANFLGGKMRKLIMVCGGMVIAALVIAGCASTQAGSRQSYKPGTYTAEGEGFHGPFSVSVTVDASKIVDIKIGETEETEGIGSRALEIIPKAVIEQQSLAVDGVSGATFTSEGLFTALEKALAQAGGNIEALKAAGK